MERVVQHKRIFVLCGNTSINCVLDALGNFCAIRFNSFDQKSARPAPAQIQPLPARQCARQIHVERQHCQYKDQQENQETDLLNAEPLSSPPANIWKGHSLTIQLRNGKLDAWLCCAPLL